MEELYLEVFISIYEFLFEVYNSRIKIFGFQKFPETGKKYKQWLVNLLWLPYLTINPDDVAPVWTWALFVLAGSKPQKFL